MPLMYFIYKHKNKKVAMFEFHADFQTDGLLDISRIMLISIAVTQLKLGQDTVITSQVWIIAIGACYNALR